MNAPFIAYIYILGPELHLLFQIFYRPRQTQPYYNFSLTSRTSSSIYLHISVPTFTVLSIYLSKTPEFTRMGDLSPETNASLMAAPLHWLSVASTHGAPSRIDAEWANLPRNDEPLLFPSLIRSKPFWTYWYCRDQVMKYFCRGRHQAKESILVMVIIAELMMNLFRGGASLNSPTKYDGLYRRWNIGIMHSAIV